LYLLVDQRSDPSSKKLIVLRVQLHVSVGGLYFYSVTSLDELFEFNHFLFEGVRGLLNDLLVLETIYFVSQLVISAGDLLS